MCCSAKFSPRGAPPIFCSSKKNVSRIGPGIVALSLKRLTRGPVLFAEPRC